MHYTLRSLVGLSFSFAVVWFVYVASNARMASVTGPVHPPTAIPTTHVEKNVAKPVPLIHKFSYDPLSLAAVLPVNETNVEHVPLLLSPFLRPSARLQEVVIVCPDSIVSQVRRQIRGAVAATEQHDHPEILLRSWSTTTHQKEAVFHAVSHVATAWLLLLDHTGLRDVDDKAVDAIFERQTDPISYGPIDINGAILLRSDMPCISALQLLQSSPPLSPPLLIPMALFPDLILTPAHDIWPHLKQRLLDSLSLPSGTNGKLLSLAEFGWCTTTTTATSYFANNVSPNHGFGSDADIAYMPLALYQAQVNNTEPTRRTGHFAVILFSLEELDAISPVLCRLLASGHQVRTLITNFLEPGEAQNPYIASEHCRLSYDSSSNDVLVISSMEPIPWLETLRHWPDVILVEQSLKDSLHKGLLTEPMPALVGIPHADLPYTAWMGTLSIKEWERKSISIMGICNILAHMRCNLNRLEYAANRHQCHNQ
jgi:hypothetical protein